MKKQASQKRVRYLHHLSFVSVLAAILFFIPSLAAAQEPGVAIRHTQPIIVPPGPDYALMRDTSANTGAKTAKTDGKATPGETLFLDLRLENRGTGDLHGLRAELTSDDQRIGRQIFLEKREVFIGNLAAGASTTLSAGGKGSGTGGNTPQFFFPDGIYQTFRFSLEEQCSGLPIVFKIIFRDSSDKEWTDTLTIPVNPPEDSTNIGGLSFFLTTKIIDDGSILNAGIDWEYNRSFSGGFEFRRTKISYNESWWGLENSLVAIDSSSYDFFLYPVKYDIIRSHATRLWLGAGAYYSNSNSILKGYFDHPELEVYGYVHLNYIDEKNDVQELGPYLGLGFTYRGSDWFKATIKGDTIPIFARWYDLEASMLPLIVTPSTVFKHSYLNRGGPGIYGTLNGIISLPHLGALFRQKSLYPSNWKLWFSVSAGYVIFRHDSSDVEYDSDSNLYYNYVKEVKVTTRSISVEGAILIPIAGLHLQIGGGRSYGSTDFDSELRAKETKNFINISGKMIKF